MPIGYSLALEDGRRFYLPTNHRGGGNLDRSIVRRYLNAELKGKTLVTLAGKFDIQMSRKDGIDLEALGCKIREVQYSAALLSDLRRSFKMEDLAFDYLGRHKLEMDRSRIWELPAYHVGPYAEEDAGITLDLDTVLSAKIKEEELDRVLDLENDLIWCVCEMERNGAPIDTQLLARWRRETSQRFQEIIRTIHEETGLKVNPNSATDLAQLFGLLKLEYPRTASSERFPQGQPSFTDAFLKTVKHRLSALAREGRMVDSLSSKYLGKYEDGLIDGVLYYQLHQLKSDEYGTIAGRFSSSAVEHGKIGANIQQVFDRERQALKMGYEKAVNANDYSNVPWLVRNLIKPVDGKKWVKADASQIEFRLFVHYSRSARLIKIFNEAPDTDFHEQVGEFCGIRRKAAKNYNFARLFGAGRDKTSTMLGLPRPEADKMYEIYDEKFPETKDLMDEVMGIAKTRGYVKTIMGRRARFPNGERLHSALNRVIQGSAADILKRKLLQVYNLRHKLGLTLRFTVHDELDGDVPDEHAGTKLKQVLEEPLEDLKIRVPLTWDVKVAENWGACS